MKTLKTLIPSVGFRCVPTQGAPPHCASCVIEEPHLVFSLQCNTSEREEGARVQEAAHSPSASSEMDAQTKKRQTVISPEKREVRIVLSPEIPHDTRICIEDLVDTDFDVSDSDELRDEREVQDENADIRHAELAQRTRSNAQMKSSAATWVEESHITSCGSSEWSEMSVSSVGSWTRSFSAKKRWFVSSRGLCHLLVLCFPPRLIVCCHPPS